MKRLAAVAGLGVLSVLGACGEAPSVILPPQDPSVRVLSGADFSDGTASMTLRDVSSEESIAVIPIYATQNLAPAAISYQIKTTGLETASQNGGTPQQRKPVHSPEAKQHERHVKFLEMQREQLTDLRNRGVRPLNQGLQTADLDDNCPAPYTVGTTRCDFYVTPDEAEELINTTLRFESANAYWFIDDRYFSEFTQSDLTRMAQSFEDNVVPVDTDHFGAFPDFDGNGKIFIVLTSLNSYGYVYAIDFFDDDEVFPSFGVHSNEGDIFYAFLPSDNVRFGFEREAYFTFNLPSTLVHELKHLISLGIRTQLPEQDFQGYEESWFEEGSAVAAEELSEYSSKVSGYAQSQALESLKNPAAFRIVDDNPDTGPEFETGSWYGYNFLHLWHIAERVGHEKFWKNWTAGPEIGIANIEKNALPLGSFAELTTDWATTLMFDHTDLFEGYDYQTLDLRDGTWEPLGYGPLFGTVSGTTRSLAYHVGKGMNQDVTLNITTTDITPYVTVVRFTGDLPY